VRIGLVLVDTYPENQFVKWVVSHCLENFRFDQVYLLSNENFLSLSNWYRISPIHSTRDYSDIIINVLPHIIQSDYILIIQWDGYIIDASKWTNEFLDYDYIGAVWEGHHESYNVGNGGFSLRSRKLIEVIRNNQRAFLPADRGAPPEDENICKLNRDLLESQGVRFAPASLARLFSYEGHVFTPSFGFHGPKNIARFTPEEILIRHHREILARISHPVELLNFLTNLSAYHKHQAFECYVSSINLDPALSRVLSQHISSMIGNSKP